VPVSHAAAYGAIVGILIGAFIALVCDMQITDAAYRLGILAMGGGWIGSVLAFLNELLTPDNHVGSGSREH